jgi:hypothetical protein
MEGPASETALRLVGMKRCFLRFKAANQGVDARPKTDHLRNQNGPKQAMTGTNGLRCCWMLLLVLKERLMTNDNNNKNPNVKQPGENPDGKYHFNPGNMAGKKPGDAKETDENRGKAPEPEEKPAG